MTNIISQMSYCLNMVVSEKKKSSHFGSKRMFSFVWVALDWIFLGLPSGGNLPKKKKMLGYIIPFFDAFTIITVHNTWYFMWSFFSIACEVDSTMDYAYNCSHGISFCELLWSHLVGHIN